MECDSNQETNALRTRISDAVHHAVCEYTDSDGFGKCMFYALAGAVLATHVFQKSYVPQVGALYVYSELGSERVFVIDPANDGFRRGEFHCWIALAENHAPGETAITKEIVDLTSRHYRKYAENLFCIKDCEQSEGGVIITRAEESERPEWKRPEPPEFIWTDDATFPELMKVVPDPESTKFLATIIKDVAEDVKQIVKLAFKHYEGTDQDAAGARDPVRMSGTAPKQRRHRKIGRNERCPCGSGRKFKKCCIKEFGVGKAPASGCCDMHHRWIVFSTALTEGWLMLNCAECGAMGTVNDPSKVEWSEAYSAPSKPYKWEDNARVTFRQSGPVYVSKNPRDTEKILVPKSPLSDVARQELNILKEVVIKGELDGKLFPLYIDTCEDHTGYESSRAVKQLAKNIQTLVDRDRVFTPATMAIVIREYLRESPSHGDG